MKIETKIVENPLLQRFIALIGMQKRVRTAPKNEILFAIVNESQQVFSYTQSAIYYNHKIIAASGAEKVDNGSPYAAWLKDFIKNYEGKISTIKEPTPGILQLSNGEVEKAKGQEWIPGFIMMAELENNKIWLVARKTDFLPWEREMFAALAGSYGQSLKITTSWRPKSYITRKKSFIIKTLVALVVVGLSIMPINETALAPAESVPVSPSFIKAPYQGVISKILVKSNEKIIEGQPLVELDSAQSIAQAEIAERTLSAANAELLQATQEAMMDSRARNRLPILRSKVEEAEAELNWQNTRLSRAIITSPKDGIAVFDDISALIGKPVEIGEKIMLVANPTTNLIEIHLPVSDALLGKNGNKALFFPNADPLNPIQGVISFVSHTSNSTPDGTISHTLRFFSDTGEIRLGSKGTAKIIGGERPLILWMLRKPIAAARLWLAI